jgi:hypothetical protein
VAGARGATSGNSSNPPAILRSPAAAPFGAETNANAIKTATPLTATLGAPRFAAGRGAPLG